MSKNNILNVFILEVYDRADKKKALFSETFYLCGSKETYEKDIYMIDRIKTSCLISFENKKSHSFLKALDGKDWCLDVCLAERKEFKNKNLLEVYIKDNKIKNGPLLNFNLDGS
jgi:hypothetical protein